MSDGLFSPFFMLFDAIPFSMESLLIILPFALKVAGVGLIESLLTLTLVDEMTDTRGSGEQRINGARRGKCSNWFLWWNGWLRNDRSDDDQYQFWCKSSTVFLFSRYFPLILYAGTRRNHCRSTDRCIGWSNVYGGNCHFRMGEFPSLE